MNSEYKEIFDKIKDDFRNLIGKLTCRGEFWGKGGSLFWEKTVSEIYKTFGEEFYELLSSSSSTYYAASGNAASRAKESGLYFKVLWYWNSWKCLRTAERLSDKFASLKKMEDMSLGELDVRACILHKSGRRNEALKYLRQGLIRQTGTKHDLCLFLIHEAEVLVDIRRDKAGYNGDEKAMENYKQAMKLTEDETVPVSTKVRVMKSYGKLMEIHGETKEAVKILNNALTLAESNKLNDQAVKIKALLYILILK